MTPDRLLVVTAVEAERDAAAAGLAVTPSILGPYPALTATTAAGRIDMIAGGVGCAAAAAATATALTTSPYSLVLSVGIGGGFGGGFDPVAPGTIVVASAIVHADLGSDSPTGFLAADALGLGPVVTTVPPELAAALTARTGGRLGAVLTVSTVTGTAAGAAALLERYPDAAAEGMEGAGVAAAARARGIAVAELRTVSNRVGPRDRGAWQIGTALAALTAAVAALCAEPLPWVS